MGKHQTPNQQARLLALWPTRNLTAAEVMEAEMPIGWVGGLNTAAGPTYAEVWWREWENELEERRV